MFSTHDEKCIILTCIQHSTQPDTGIQLLSPTCTQKPTIDHLSSPPHFILRNPEWQGEPPRNSQSIFSTSVANKTLPLCCLWLKQRRLRHLLWGGKKKGV